MLLRDSAGQPSRAQLGQERGLRALSRSPAQDWRPGSHLSAPSVAHNHSFPLTASHTIEATFPEFLFLGSSCLVTILELECFFLWFCDLVLSQEPRTEVSEQDFLMLA